MLPIVEPEETVINLSQYSDEKQLAKPYFIATIP